VVAQYYSKQQWVNPIRTIITKQYKYNRYIKHGEELYDLDNDPDEVTNLIDDPGYAPIKDKLSRKLDQWLKDNQDPFDTFRPTDRQGAPLHKGEPE
jgi:hypothetical protein